MMKQPLVSSSDHHDDVQDIHSSSVTSVVVDVEHLSYGLDASFTSRLRESALRSDWAPQVLQDRIALKLHSDVDAELVDISFRARPGQVTAIISLQPSERKTLMELVAGRRIYGHFDGEVSLFESNPLRSTLTSTNSLAYIPREAVSLYMPGLTYSEMVTYAARLRMRKSSSLQPNSSKLCLGALSDFLCFMLDDAQECVTTRVNEVLRMMNLLWCKDRVITERPTSRGSLGGELRKMAIACAIINFPPVLIFDDITADLDEQVSNEIVDCLKLLADRNHTVLASFQSPNSHAFGQFSSVVLLREGRSIYSSAVENIYPFFCEHSEFSYAMPEDGLSCDVGTFLLDIATGAERPVGQRFAPDACDLQRSFESSKYFVSGDESDTQTSLSILPEQSVSYIETLSDFNMNDIFAMSLIQLERAFYLKLRETDILRRMLCASIGLSLIFGYIVYQMGDSMDYVVSFFVFPYNETLTLTGCLYVFSVVPFGMQVLSAHIINQKMNVFMFERRGNCVSTFGFIVSSMLSELLFAATYCFIFSNIAYYMSALNDGLDAYVYYMCLTVLLTCLGTVTILLATAFFRGEIAVRNFYVFALTICAMTAGLMYQYPYVRSYMKSIATINPFRWTFASLMGMLFILFTYAVYRNFVVKVWMWEKYPDGATFLRAYGFAGFDKSRVWVIFGWFFLCDIVAYVYLLLPEKNELYRKRRVEAYEGERYESIDFDADASFSSRSTYQTSPLKPRESSLLKPEVLSRESSFSAKSVLTKKTSSFNTNDIEDDRGPVVSFSDLAYRVPDKSSPVGRKEVLHTMSGRFDWGKLSVIMGAEGAGKSSLLHLVGSQKLSSSAEISGRIYYNDRDIGEGRFKAWQKCAFVEALDDHFRDLTVEQCVRYALELRLEEHMPEAVLTDTVDQTLTLLQLSDFRKTKVKYLSAGQSRRVSIAEEIVSGPLLVLLDEPITGLDARESSIIMTHTLREMVNQNRTVICTMHQPSAAVFDLFDTLVLLSKGRLIYMGSAQKAVEFFVSSPSLSICHSSFKNPAEFLFGISGGLIKNSMGTVVNAESLERNYLESSVCYNYESMSNGNIVKFENDPEIIEDGWRCASFDSTPADSFVRKSMARSKSKESPSYYDLMFRKYFFPFMSVLYDIGHIDMTRNMRRSGIILRRACRVLYQRPRMVFVTTMTHFLTALFTVYLVEPNVEDSAAVITPCAAFGGFLLMMINVQFAFFLFHNQKVFLREHSRGLYSTFLRWLVEPLPLLLLRSIQGLIYAITIHEMLNLQGGYVGIYFYLMTWFMCIAVTMIIEMICYTLKDIRDVYGASVSLAMVLFLFSGLFFKPSTLPGWMGPWLPSISIIRWYAQGIVNNEFDDNLRAFATITTPLGEFNTYTLYLNMFGWGGKSKWYSFRIVILNLVIFRLLQLFVSWKTAVSQRGQRAMRRKEISADKIY